MNLDIKGKEEIRKEGKRKTLRNSLLVLQLDLTEGNVNCVSLLQWNNADNISMNICIFTTHIEGIQ